MSSDSANAAFPTKLLHSFECGQGAVRAVRYNGERRRSARLDLSKGEFSVDGKYCMTCGADKTLILWNPVRKLMLKTYRGVGSELLDAAGSCDNSMVLVGGRDKQPTIFDVESGKMLKRWREHGGVVNAVAFNEDSRVALSASQDTTIRAFDVRTRNAAFQVCKFVSYSCTTATFMRPFCDGKDGKKSRSIETSDEFSVCS